MNVKSGDEVDIRKAVVQQISFAGVTGISADMLRLDLIHPVISGNKWFKLTYHFADMAAANATAFFTYGGAWSNHIVAAACMAKQAGVDATGFIRGEIPANLSNTLRQAIGYGMSLRFLDRTTYAATADGSGIVLSEGNPVYMIPQGGAGEAGVRGCMEILSLADREKYSHIICCIGTGTMYEGIARTINEKQELLGVAVLKSTESFPAHHKLLETGRLNNRLLKIIPGYHFGGYAKKTTALIAAMNVFYLQTGVPTDFVYTGKMVYAVQDMIAKNYFPPGSRLLIIHSGGLQGNKSLPAGTLIF